MVETALTSDHRILSDDGATRRYFAKFDRITRLLASVAAEMEAQGGLGPQEAAIVGTHVAAIAATFRALSMKYLVAGRLEGVLARHLTIDLHESGFPIYQEIATMANDAVQAASHLAGLPDAAALRDEMVREMLATARAPVRQQYAMSQRLYYQRLVEGGLFWPQMHPEIVWLGAAGARQRYRMHWAVYDSQLNVPVIYLMELEDSGKRPLAQDQARREAVRGHLLAQSGAGLKLVTIARGFDRDFDDLHPKRLRRLHLGPMYSSAYTLQSGPIREVLEEARAPVGDDWAMAWTLEDLLAERVEVEKGWFSAVERQVFSLDPLAGGESGATAMTRALILPQRPYQVLVEKDPPGFRNVQKYVVGSDGRVVVYG